jgi:hypothetical protein
MREGGGEGGGLRFWKCEEEEGGHVLEPCAWRVARFQL